MTDPLRKPTSGEPFAPSAKQTGAFIDAVIGVQQLQRQMGSTKKFQGGPPIVQIQNASGGDVTDSHGIFAIGSPIISPSDRDTVVFDAPTFSCTLAGSSSKAVAIAKGPVGEDAIVLATASGHAWAKIDLPDSATYQFCKPQDGTKFEAVDIDDAVEGDLLIPVWWHEAGPGTKDSIVVLPGQFFFSQNSGTCADPCGCGPRSEAAMTVEAADFGGLDDAACSYVIEGRELTYQGSGVWQSASFSIVVSGSTVSAVDVLTATGQGIEELMLERKVSGTAVATWKNTVMWWDPPSPHTLYVFSDNGPGYAPVCSICVGLDDDLIADCAS